MPGARILPHPPLILTRPEAQGRAFARAAREAGIDGPVLFAPVLAIVPAAGGPLPAGVLVFTSANGVAAAGDIAGRRVWAVGAATGRAAARSGAEVRVAGGSVDALARALAAEAPRERVVHLRGAHVAGDLVARLRAAGIDAAGRVVYDQRAVPLGAAARRALAAGPALLPLFSARTARLVGAALEDPPAAVRVLAISRDAAAAWPWPGEVRLAAQPDGRAMIDGLCGLVARETDR